MTSGHKLAAAAAILICATSMPAHAAPISALAGDNATVQPGGPRSGTSGKAFLNIEGSNNGSFASYGVADFNFGVLPSTVIAVNSARLSLTQANASFSTTGDVVLSLDQSAPLVDIQPVTSPLAYDGIDPGTGQDVTDGDLSLLGFVGGPFTYTVGTSGDVDAYSLGLTPPIAAELVTRLNNVAPIRLVVGTGSATVAATWAGYYSTTYVGPTLLLDVTYDTGTPTQSTSWGRIKAIYR
jgi:hypothetical protein